MVAGINGNGSIVPVYDDKKARRVGEFWNVPVDVRKTLRNARIHMVQAQACIADAVSLARSQGIALEQSPAVVDMLRDVVRRLDSEREAR